MGFGLISRAHFGAFPIFFVCLSTFLGFAIARTPDLAPRREWREVRENERREWQERNTIRQVGQDVEGNLRAESNRIRQSVRDEHERELRGRSRSRDRDTSI